MPAPTIQELNEALEDINSLESFINGATPDDITTRLGTIYPNLLKVTQLVTAGSATGVSFDNNNSFLNSLTVQAAIDELANGSSFFFKDYDALRDMFNSSFDGSTLREGQIVHVTNPGIAGAFILRQFDSNTDSNAVIDNGGTIIVIDSDWYAQRIYSGHVEVEWFGAVGDGVTNDTDAIQAAMDASLYVGFSEDTVYLVSAATSLFVRQGHRLKGGGLDSTVIYLTAEAGTAFKRVDPATDSSYVRNVEIIGIAVVFNHPATADPSNYEQVAFDFSSISRGFIRACYAGSYNRGPLRLTRTEPAAQQDAVQGYGVLIATNNTNYAGGEVNTVEDSQFYGCKKAITVDDATLAPLSVAYATTIRNNDIQVCESGIAFEYQGNAGSVVIDNTIQSVQNMRGSSATTYAYRLAGRDSYIRNKYIEVTVGSCDYILRLESAAVRNVCDLGLIGASDTFIALISDAGGWGNHNRINYKKPSTNELVTLDGNINTEIGRDKARVIFDGTAGAIQGTSMAIASVARNGAGDYTVTFDTNTFADANYNYSIDLQIDTSGSGGSAIVRTQAAGSIRVVTRNTAGTPTDALRVSIRCG